MLASYSQVLTACGLEPELFGCDINECAIRLTMQTFEANKCRPVTLIESNLLESVSGSFDVIIFNPVSH